MLRHGWHGLRALVAVLNEETRMDMWREYMATVAYSIGRIAGGEEYPIPTFAELAHPETARREEPTGREILDGLIARLKGGN